MPEGGIGRVLIYKTYKDPRTYMMHGDDIVWVRSLSGYRLGVLLPKGFAFISSNVAAQLSHHAGRPVEAGVRQPERAEQSGDDSRAPDHGDVSAAAVHRHVLRRRQDAVRSGCAGDRHASSVEQTYSDYRKGATARLDSLTYLPLQDLKVIDLDTAKPLTPAKDGGGDDRASSTCRSRTTSKARTSRSPARLTDPDTRSTNGDLVFDRTLHGLRNTVLLPAGWDVSAVSQSGTIGTYQGRAFVALINLNAENSYHVVIHARKSRILGRSRAGRMPAPDRRRALSHPQHR